MDVKLPFLSGVSSTQISTLTFAQMNTHQTLTDTGKHF